VVAVVLECFIAFAPFFFSMRRSGVLTIPFQKLMIKILRDQKTDSKEVLGLPNLSE